MTRKSLSAITADVGPVPQIPVRDDAPAADGTELQSNAPEGTAIESKT